MNTDWTPLHDAARDGDVARLRRVLDAGEVSVDATGARGLSTPLKYVSIKWHHRPPVSIDDRVACFKLLRDAGASLDTVDRDSWTPLHHAAIRAHVEILTLLVEAGANVNAADSDGCTALHFAPSTRALACVEVLLAAGASVNARNVSGRTPFDAALSNDKRRWWPLFLRAGAQIPSYPSHPYILHVRNAGGFKKYEQAHLARITAILAQTPRLPPEMVRKIVEFWLHAGYY